FGPPRAAHKGVASLSACHGLFGRAGALVAPKEMPSRSLRWRRPRRVNADPGPPRTGGRLGLLAADPEWRPGLAAATSSNRCESSSTFVHTSRPSRRPPRTVYKSAPGLSVRPVHTSRIGRGWSRSVYRSELGPKARAAAKHVYRPELGPKA